MMKISEVSVNADYFCDDEPIDAVTRLRRCGFRRVEFRGADLHRLSDRQLGKLAGRMKADCITCSAVNTVGDLVPVSLGNLAAAGISERENAVAHVQKCTRLANKLKAPRIVCDVGSTTEDFITMSDKASLKAQNKAFVSSCRQVVEYAGKFGIGVVLLPVPGRRWVAWDGLPAKPLPVPEMHVWPWRLWTSAETLMDIVEKAFGNKVGWAFDTANEFVAHNTDPFSLKDNLPKYIGYKLDVVYLANHPGPLNGAWHRLLLHRSLDDGAYTVDDFRTVLTLLKSVTFTGQVTLQISDEHPSDKNLKRNLAFIKRLLKTL